MSQGFEHGLGSNLQEHGALDVAQAFLFEEKPAVKDESVIFMPDKMSITDDTVYSVKPKINKLVMEGFTAKEIAQLNPVYNELYTTELKQKIDALAKSPKENLEELKPAYLEYINRTDFKAHRTDITRISRMVEALETNKDFQLKDGQLVPTFKKITWDRALDVHKAVVHDLERLIAKPAVRQGYASLLLEAGDVKGAAEQNRYASQFLGDLKVTHVVDGKPIMLSDVMSREYKTLLEDKRVFDSNRFNVHTPMGNHADRAEVLHERFAAVALGLSAMLKNQRAHNLSALLKN